VEQAVARDEPKALACYGPLARWRADPASVEEAIWLRCVDGRPLSGVTTQFLAWCYAKLAAAGKAALLPVWDNAGWQIGKEVRTRIAAHNRRVNAGDAAVRTVARPLPTKSPWLNPIEPKWTHGQRRVMEPARRLTVAELEERVDAAFGCAHEDHLA
jgi:hypothetical protein